MLTPMSRFGHIRNEPTLPPLATIHRDRCVVSGVVYDDHTGVEEMSEFPLPMGYDFDAHGRMRYEITGCARCPLVDFAYEHGGCGWSCKIAGYISNYGKPKEVIPARCPLRDGVVFNLSD